MKNILRNSNFGFTKWCVALIAAGWMGAGTGWGATAYQMSSGDKTWNFSDIANWTGDFASGVDAANWGSVAVNASGAAGDGVKISTSTAAFSTSTSGGVQKGTGNVYLLSTGTANSCAIDLYLNFLGRNAGTVSFDVATVFNTTGNKDSVLKLFYTLNGTTFTEITGTSLPYTARNNVTGSATVSVVLPSALNNVSSVRLRFYEYSTSGAGTPAAGSQPKISIDNVAVTSTTASANPEVTSFSPTVGKTGSSITITGANFGSSTPTVSFNGTAATVSSFTSTSIVVTVPVGAATGKISVTAGGLAAQSLTDFTVDNVAPLVSTYSPADNASSAVPGSIKITFSEAIAKGTGNIRIKKTSDNSVVETIAVSATQVIDSGSVLTIKPTTSLAYSTGFYVEYDAGIVTDLAGNSLAAGISGNSAWNFITRAESPVIITQYYEGVSNNKFIEIANVGGTPLTLTGYSLVLWSNADAEGWKNTNTYAPSTDSILDLSTVTLAPGQVCLVANPGALLPIPAASANISSKITYFNGNDSVVLHYTGNGLTINDPGSVVDAVSFTNLGIEGLDKSFVRTAMALGFSLDSGSNITQFSDVWQSVTLATADAAASGTDAYLGYTSLATPPASLAFSSGSVTVNEDAGTVNLTVVLSAAAATQVTAAVALDSSSTVTAADIGNFATQTVTFPAGSAAGSTQTVVVTITDDSEAELSEKAVFKIQNIVGNAVAGAPVTSTINIRPSDNTIANLLISEVPDPSNGSGNYRYIELYNPGATDVDLATGQWNLVRYSNGGTGAQAIPLTGTVRAGGTFVIAYSASFSTGYPAASLPDQTSSQINGNGDDVYTLYFGGDNTQGLLRDIYGVVGELGAGTWGYAGKRAVRKSSVVAPNPVWTANEWFLASAASGKMTPSAHPDTAPIITSALTAIATVGTAFEYQIAANNNPTVYSAAGLPAELQFSASTGLISGTPASATTLSVTIQAINGGGTDSKTLTITIGSPNSAPTGIVLSSVSFPENNLPNQVVGTLTATDDNAAGATYAFATGAGDADNGAFNISGNSLRATNALDFDTKSSYSVLIQVTDAGGLTFTQQLTITLTNVNEAPSITSSGAVNAAENQTAVQTVTGTDPDAGTTLIYRISGGADSVLFTIDSSTGVLTFVSARDYETPTDVGTNNVYDVIVEVSDGTLTATKAVAVTVTNVIDSPADYKADWLATNGLAAGSDWNSDPNSVGYSLATAYAFGLDPKARSGSPITLVSSPTGSVKVVYLQRDISSGVTYAVKTGTDLAAGLNGNDAIINVSASQPSPAITGYTRYEATYTPSAPATKGFAKVQAIVP